MTIYRLKNIKFDNRVVRIILQNENGPCPLLAIANILLLRNALQLRHSLQNISEENLLTMIAEYLIDNNPIDDTAEFAADLRRNLDDVISSLPKLATGIDVNPKFNSIKDFEFTNEIAIFDLCNVNIVHGWLVDPEEKEIFEAIGNLSYNQMVCKLITTTPTEAPLQNKIKRESALIDLKSPRSHKSNEAVSVKLFPNDASIMVDFIYKKIPVENLEINEGNSDGERERLLGLNHEDSAMKEFEEVQNSEIRESESSPLLQAQQMSDESLVENDKFNLKEALEEGKEEIKLFPAVINSEVVASGSSKAAVTGNIEDFSKKPSEDDLRLSRIVRNWLDSNSSQLTHHGLFTLHDTLEENCAVVLFRNNHFNTLFKKNKELYLLVTDQGYQSETDVVWEKLDNLNNDTKFFTADFFPFVEHVNLSQTPHDNELYPDHESKEDADFALALQLQEEEKARVESLTNHRYSLPYRPEPQIQVQRVQPPPRQLYQHNHPGNQQYTGSTSNLASSTPSMWNKFCSIFKKS